MPSSHVVPVLPIPKCYSIHTPYSLTTHGAVAILPPQRPIGEGGGPAHSPRPTDSRRGSLRLRSTRPPDLH